MRPLHHLLISLGLALAALLGSAAATAASVPDEVVRLARAYAAAHPGEPTRPGVSLQDEYAMGYFRGFTSGGDIGTDSPIRKESHEQGRARWLEGPAAREMTFAGFGYQRVELTGSWSTGFEASLFSPEGSGGAYWLNFLPDCQTDMPGGNGERAYTTQRVQVSGYVSPRGQYGHLGIYGQELLATSVRRVSDVPAKKP